MIYWYHWKISIFPVILMSIRKMTMYSFICQGQIYDVEDQFMQFSPLLKTLFETKLEVEVKNGYPIIGDDDPMFRLMGEYLLYLSGQSFTLNNEEEKELFIDLYDYMGGEPLSPSLLALPPPMFAMKMTDNWRRTHLLSFNEDPFFGLVEIPRVRDYKICLERQVIPDGTYIAGGYAMYLAGWSDKYKDVDLFFTRKDALIELLKEICSDMTEVKGVKYVESTDDDEDYSDHFRVTKNSVELIHGSVTATGDNLSIQRPSIQGILRLYSCPSEIIHGFDVDCCGILYDPSSDKLYATERALYAFLNKTNIFDPERSSPSYVYRLTKYALRGYDIYIPGYDESRLDQEKVHILLNYLKEIFTRGLIESAGFRPGEVPIPEEYKRFLAVNVASDYDVEMTEGFPDGDFITRGYASQLRLLNPERPWGQIMNYYQNEIEWYNLILMLGCSYTSPRKISPVDRLILMKTLSIFVPYEHGNYPSDYSDRDAYNYEDGYEIPRERGVDTYIIFKNGYILVPPLSWKEQDPGTQVTSTFTPEPIPDLEEWLSSSTFIVPRQD